MDLRSNKFGGVESKIGAMEGRTKGEGCENGGTKKERSAESRMVYQADI